MKKIFVLLLVVIVTLGLVACEAPAGSSGKSGDLITVGFAQCKADESDWRKANTKSVQEALSNSNGFDLILADSNNDAAKQVSDVQGFIDQEVDYIIIAAVNVDGWDTVLKNAKDAGIPVILMDRTINAGEDLYECWLGSDFYGEGVKATDWMKTRFVGGTAGNIVHLQGQLGASAQVGRTEALEDAIAANGWTLLAQQTGDWSTDTAKEITASWIQQFGDDITCVYAENDNMADGAIQALEEAGKKVGGDDGVAIISFDANRAYLQMTLEGKINCNVECNPLHGPKVADIIKSMENGVKPSKTETVEESAFFYDTITQEIVDARSY
ncbi:MAG TPA: ABC transporter substrate-binding protein [Thermoclostridium sp.]|nr:ABC transporter substrate-binding protein [Thermoclostridium sp.]